MLCNVLCILPIMIARLVDKCLNKSENREYYKLPQIVTLNTI